MRSCSWANNKGKSKTPVRATSTKRTVGEDVPVPVIETVQVPHEVIRTVEVPFPVEQIVEKIVEKIVHVPVPVTRQEHVTRQVVQNTLQQTRAPPQQLGTQVLPGRDLGVTSGIVRGGPVQASSRYYVIILLWHI